jgi:hypothetical protein
VEKIKCKIKLNQKNIKLTNQINYKICDYLYSNFINSLFKVKSPLYSSLYNMGKKNNDDTKVIFI